MNNLELKEALENLAHNIRILMSGNLSNHKKITIKKLGEISGVSSSEINKILSLNKNDINLGTIINIAQALNTSWHMLLKENLNASTEIFLNKISL